MDNGELRETIGWTAAGILVFIGWIWKAAKEHSKVSALQSDMAEVKRILPTLVAYDDHDTIQRQCWDKRDKGRSDELHAVTLAYKAEVQELRDEMAIMNANLCKLMGRLDVEPVRSKDRRRRSDATTPVL